MADFIVVFNPDWFPQQQTDAMNRAMSRLGTEIEAAIRAITPVDTGFLRDHVQVTVTTGSVSELEVRTPDYGKYVEGGTVNMSAQPFIDPIVRGQSSRWERRLARLLKEETR